MDTLEAIKSKIKLFSQLENSSSVRAVILHIEIAEKYFHRAKSENDYNLFTDVIYRTNQTFEGILKEAYSIFSNKKSSTKSPNEIEKYLANQGVFKEHVKELFATYRTQWRNKATHDHQLFFSEQEAFLAIVNVSAFVNFLLDQMIEKIAFENEKLEVEKRKSKLKQVIENYAKLNLTEKITAILFQFSHEMQDIHKPQTDSEKEINLSEFELSGRLMGFISSIDPDLNIQSEVPIKAGNVILRPDIMISENMEQVIVVLKRSPHLISYDFSIDSSLNQLLSYLIASGINQGILYYPPIHCEGKTAMKEYKIHSIDTDKHVICIGPSELFPVKYVT